MILDQVRKKEKNKKRERRRSAQTPNPNRPHVTSPKAQFLPLLFAAGVPRFSPTSWWAYSQPIPSLISFLSFSPSLGLLPCLGPGWKKKSILLFFLPCLASPTFLFQIGHIFCLVLQPSLLLCPFVSLPPIIFLSPFLLLILKSQTPMSLHQN